MIAKKKVLRLAKWFLTVAIIAAIAIALNAIISTRKTEMERLAKEAASIKINIDEDKVKEMADIINRVQEQYQGN